ncbi:MAG: (d)CMP kinase [Deltaproteobacteria bacterium]
MAIDGPAGAGKTTVARRVASALGYVLVDTGAIYRAVAYAAKKRGVAWDDRPAMEALAHSLVDTETLSLAASAGDVPRMRLDGQELAEEIRTPELSMGASTVSAFPGVRDALLDLQRRFGANGGVVLEGRDIGTVVFPDAEVKVFLTATDADRAERRFRELQSRGVAATLEKTLEEVRTRDRQDSERAVAPLRAADDAVRIDSSRLTVDDVVAAVVSRARASERC